MRAFYEGVLGFKPVTELNKDAYIEYHSEGYVRFAICETGCDGGRRSARRNIPPRPCSGQRVELAFPCESPAAVDRDFKRIIAALERRAGGACPGKHALGPARGFLCRPRRVL